MNPRLRRLAADMLREYADRLSNDGCNDWTPPDYMTAEDRAELALTAWESNGEQPDEDRNEPVQQNWIAALAVAYALDGGGS